MAIDWDLETERQQALEQCHRLLAGRAYTEHQLAEKLRGKLLPGDAVEWALGRCREQRLVDDAAYSKVFIQQRLARGHGARKIRQDLAKRGVTAAVVEAAFEELDGLGDAPVDRCVELVARRFEPEALADMRQRAKAFRYLVTRGFESGEAERAIERVRSGEHTA